MERQDSPVIQDHREFQEMMAHRVNQDHREHQANRTMSRENLVRTDPLEPQENLALMVPQDPQENLERNKDHMEKKVLLESKELQVLLEKLE